LNFFRLGLKVLFTAPKFEFLGDFTPKIWGHIDQTPKRHYLKRNDAFRALVDPDLTHSTTYGLGKEKKDSGKLAIRPDHPRRRIEVKVCMPGGLRCLVLYIKFY